MFIWQAHGGRSPTNIFPTFSYQYNSPPSPSPTTSNRKKKKTSYHCSNFDIIQHPSILCNNKYKIYPIPVKKAESHAPANCLISNFTSLSLYKYVYTIHLYIFNVVTANGYTMYLNLHLYICMYNNDPLSPTLYILSILYGLSCIYRYIYNSRRAVES